MPTQVKKNSSKNHKSASKDWFKFINDDDKSKPAIPIGPRFQADVAEWRGPLHSALNGSDSTKWLGNVIWSPSNNIPESKGDVIGKGRLEQFCNCSSPGSVPCVKRHVSKKSEQLQIELGPAFKFWKFDQMGEGVAKFWKQTDQQKFNDLMKKNLLSEGNEFIKPAMECFRSKSRKDIVNYYFNVHIPRRISLQTRSNCKTVDTDDDEEEEEKEKEEEKFINLCSKKSKKRNRDDGKTFYGSKLVKKKYLVGRR